MSIPLPPFIGTGFSESSYSPDYINLHSKDNLQERTNASLVHGAPVQKGAILSKDSLDIPLEVQFNIANDKSEASRPLPRQVFFRSILEDVRVETEGPNHYQELLNSLSPLMQKKLEQDKRLDSEERDPDLVALDTSLKFAAALLGHADRAGKPTANSETLALEIAAYKALPDVTRDATADFSGQVASFLDAYLNEIGPNDPSYDLLMQISKALKEGKQKLYG